MDLPEIVRQLERLHRDLAGDLPAAIGHAKDLVESACKNILGQTAPGHGTKGPAWSMQPCVPLVATPAKWMQGTLTWLTIMDLDWA